MITPSCPDCGHSYTVWNRDGYRHERCLQCGFKRKTPLDDADEDTDDAEAALEDTPQ